MKFKTNPMRKRSTLGDERQFVQFQTDGMCDDPEGLSGTNEQDSRHITKILDLPLLEPATF